MVAEIIAGIIRGLGGILEQHLGGSVDADEAVMMAKLELDRLEDWLEEAEDKEKAVLRGDD